MGLFSKTPKEILTDSRWAQLRCELGGNAAGAARRKMLLGFARACLRYHGVYDVVHAKALRDKIKKSDILDRGELGPVFFMVAQGDVLQALVAVTGQKDFPPFPSFVPRNPSRDQLVKTFFG